MMVTIINQWVEQISIGVQLSFPVNCNASYNKLVTSSYEPNTVEFEAEMQVILEAEEIAFKNSPDYSTQDVDKTRGSWSLVSFGLGMGVINITFDVIDAVITLNQYYGVSDELTQLEIQESIDTQVQQYEINYKIGYNLTDL